MVLIKNKSVSNKTLKVSVLSIPLKVSPKTFKTVSEEFEESEYEYEYGYDEDLDETKHLLVFLEIASKMGFEDAEKNLVNQLHDSFIFFQMYSEFSALSTKAKILVARKRLWFLLNNLADEECNDKNLFLNTESAGLLSVLVNYNQKPIDFQYNGEESKRLLLADRNEESQIANS